MLNLEGRVAAIFGLANKRSIAWGIAQKLHEAGAKLAISYQNERMKAEAAGLILTNCPARSRSNATCRTTRRSSRTSRI